MAMGMTYEQYWFGDPLMATFFYKADRLRRERVNEEAWITGIYMMKAIAGTIGNVFLGKGEDPITYPEEPIRLYSEEKPAEKADSPEDYKDDPDALFALAWMTSMVQAGQNWDKSVVNSDGN